MSANSTDTVILLRTAARSTAKAHCVLLFEAATELELTRHECEIWKEQCLTWQDRYEAEHHDHEATIKHCDEELARLDWEANDGRGR